MPLPSRALSLRSGLSAPIRVCLFTDTLGDVNGVSRFVHTMAMAAQNSGRDLRILTSTRFQTPDEPNIANFQPIAARPMPGYEHLELVLPPARAMLREARRMGPDVIHISTPGPVGLVGLAAARLLRVPALGVYHTDFPAYIGRLFDDAALAWLSGLSMRAFYCRFAAIFTRSADYAKRLSEMAIPENRLVPLRPGIDTEAFNPRLADPTVWSRLGAHTAAAGAPPRGGPPRVLYVGRVSVEKDLPLLTAVWRAVRRHRKNGRSAPPLPLPPQLIIVGDGPYRAHMQRELRGDGGGDVHFLGFRHGGDLAAIYASSDLFIFPSTTDTLGQVVMEAQASGLPVLVSDRGGPREVVRDGTTGRVLRAGVGGDADLWARAVLQLLADDAQRCAMGAAARAAMEPLTTQACFEHFWSVHERCAAHGPALRTVGASRDTPDARLRAINLAHAPEKVEDPWQSGQGSSTRSEVNPRRSPPLV